MHRFIYVSYAPDEMNFDTLRDISTVSNMRNRQDDLTGALLWSPGVFLQLLEGPKLELDATLARISADPRHSRMTTLVDKKVREITCGHWDMGCFPIHPTGLHSLFANPPDVQGLIEKFTATPDVELDAFFKTFYKNNLDRIEPRRRIVDE